MENITGRKLQADKKVIKALTAKKQKARELYHTLKIDAVTLDRTLQNLHKIGVIEKSGDVYRVVQ